MNKLIQTNFTYRINGKRETGSYLGRVSATVETIRRFLIGNLNACNLNTREYMIREIELTGSHVSQWIHA